MEKNKNKLKTSTKIAMIFFLILLAFGLSIEGYHLRNTAIENNRIQVSLNKNENAVVLFYKDDCSDCKAIFDRVMAEKDFVGTNIKLINLNNVKNKHYIGEYNLHYVPTLIVLHRGKEVDRYTGVDKRKINDLFKGAMKWPDINTRPRVIV